jgi:pimeloyl-ACP methyl ester carboxylesterase
MMPECPFVSLGDQAKVYSHTSRGLQELLRATRRRWNVGFKRGPDMDARRLDARAKTSERHLRCARLRVGELDMYYQMQGRGRPLLLLHAGFSTIEASFGRLRPALTGSRNTIALEQQAHGRTGDLEYPLTYEQMVEDTAAALELLRVADADVFGWSDGGVVALGLALRHPHLVRRVAIMGAASSNAGYVAGFDQRMRELRPDDPHLAALRESYEQVAPHKDCWPALVEKVKAMYFAFGGWPEDELRRLAAPLLVMVGDRDLVSLDHALRLHRMVPSGSLAVLPGSDHGAAVGRADWIAPMLLDFFEAPAEALMPG